MTNSQIKFSKVAVGLGACVVLSATSGCGAVSDAKSAAGLPSASVMETGTAKALEEQSITVPDAGLNCSVSVGDGTLTKDVTGDCSGVDTSDVALTSTLVNGSYSDARDSCTATLVVKSADKVVAEVEDFNCAD